MPSSRKASLPVAAPPSTGGQSLASLLPPALLALVVFIVFGRICTHDFVFWDDNVLVCDNPWVNPPTLQGLWHIWQQPHSHLYIPLVYTVWFVLSAAAQLDFPDENGLRLNPWIFHCANLLVHMANALMVFAILKLLLSRGLEGKAGTRKNKTPSFAVPAFAGALVFAVHPFQTESVAWVTGMKDLLGGMFSLAALWQYLKYAQAEILPPDLEDSKSGKGTYCLATGLFILALLAKPSAVVVPFLAGALDRGILRRSWRPIIQSLALWVLLAIPCMIWTRLVQPPDRLPPVALWAKPFIAADALVFYLHKLVFPLHLGMDYGRIPQVVLHSRLTYVLWVIPLLLLSLIWAWKLHRRWLMTAAAVFAMGILPVLGFVPFYFQCYSTVADRYVYLSMLAPAMVVASLLACHPGRATVVAATVVLLLLTGLSIRQAGFWQESRSLFEHAIDVNPRSYVARHNLSVYLTIRGELQQAADQLVTALDIVDSLPPETRKTSFESHTTLGQVLLKQQRYAEAARQFELMLRIQPNHREAAEGLAAARAMLAPATQPR